MATNTGQEHAIDTMLLEERTYPPPEDFSAQANAKPDIYDEPFESFWEREGRERLTWFEPFAELYDWQPPSIVTSWDSGLLDGRGRPRPAYTVVKRWLARSSHGRRAALCGKAR